jgi:hypothetical protein
VDLSHTRGQAKRGRGGRKDDGARKFREEKRRNRQARGKTFRLNKTAETVSERIPLERDRISQEHKTCQGEATGRIDHKGCENLEGLRKTGEKRGEREFGR